MSKGWIKTYRSLLEWEWYQNTNVLRVFLHCLLKANHKDRQWQGIVVKRGSFITSYQNLANELSGRQSRFSVQQVRTALTKLKLTGEITIKTTSKYTLVEVNNWDRYQEDERENNTAITNKQQSNNNQVTTNKNDNNEKNERSNIRFAPPSLEDINKYLEEAGIEISASAFCDFYSSKGWMVGRNKMKDWKAAVRNWARRNKKTEEEPKVDYSEQHERTKNCKVCNGSAYLQSETGDMTPCECIKN